MFGYQSRRTFALDFAMMFTAKYVVLLIVKAVKHFVS